MGLFENLKAPGQMDLKGSYNNKVNNTGMFNLPTKDVGIEQPQAKPIGDYGFLKNSGDYVPNTDFAQTIANKEGGFRDRLLNGLEEGLESFSKADLMNNPQISQGGFNYQNTQINPAQMIEAPQMQNSRLFNYLTV